MSLAAKFPTTPVTVRRPAVVCNFSDGSVEIVPGYFDDTVNGKPGYWIAAPGGDWMKTYPEAHSKYVTAVSKKHNGAAKQLARLLKVWKYERHVPVSSCYLEMRAAKHMDEHQWAPSHLSVNDPGGHGGDLSGYLTWSRREQLQQALSSAAERASKALAAEERGDHAEAKRLWKIILGDDFPTG